MPTLSMFYGIIVRMYWADRLPPHFHAYYQEDSAVFDLDGNLLEGSLPRKQSNLVVAWTEIHHDELAANWELARQKEDVFKIEPLRWENQMSELSSYKTFVPVVEAHAKGSVQVALCFKDGSRGTLDLSSIIGDGPWKKLADPVFFALAHAAFDTVVWDDDVDLAPEYVYEHCEFQNN